jgi:thiol-disulfide isomerase/thioredoxin
VGRGGMKTVRIALLVLTVAVGIVPMNSLPVLAVESAGLDNFHFFQEPPDANDLKVITVDDRQLSIAGLKGKVVLLNFWRQNCQYCQQEKEYLKTMIETLKSVDLAVVCVDLWDQPSWVKSYAKQNASDLLFAFRPPTGESVMENLVKGRLMGYFVLNEAKEAIYEVKGFPSTYVIDRDGKVVAAHLGMARWSDPAILKWIAALVAPAPEAAPFSPPDAYYELPAWMDRLLSSPGRAESEQRTTRVVLGHN